VHGSYHYNEELNFYSAAFEGGRMLTADRGKGLLRGRGEAVVEVLPFWLAHHPKQVDVLSNASGAVISSEFPDYSYYGVSITPLLFRWNFMKNETDRWVPFFRLGSGLLWTSQRFPQGEGDVGGKTSRINFTPQVDFGESIFTKKRQSLNVGVRAIHISSAGLGEYNPGVNVTVQFTVGYSWWK
jgi:lipid A 3-O-deacylase